MLVTMTAISVCACADKSGSDKSGEPGAVQGNYYLDADKSKQYISFNEDNSFRFVGYDFEVLAKDLVGDMIEDKTALPKGLTMLIHIILIRIRMRFGLTFCSPIAPIPLNL